MQTITFRRVDAHGRNTLFIKMKRDTRLDSAMRAYCDRNRVNRDTLLFQVVRTGAYCSPQDTPNNLSLVQNEKIRVLVDTNDV